MLNNKQNSYCMVSTNTLVGLRGVYLTKRVHYCCISLLQVDDTEAFPNYPYRDDALLIFDAIHVYVREVLESFYGT